MTSLGLHGLEAKPLALQIASQLGEHLNVIEFTVENDPNQMLHTDGGFCCGKTPRHY